MLDGAVQETATAPSPATPVTVVGAPGLDRNDVSSGYSELEPKFQKEVQIAYIPVALVGDFKEVVVLPFAEHVSESLVPKVWLS